MNYLVYFKDTGRISHTSNVNQVDDKLDSIEISFDDMNLFLTNKKNISHYCVISDAAISDYKELLHINDFEQTWNQIENRIFKITQSSTPQLIIEQSKKHKVCAIRTVGITKERLKKHQLEHMVFAACAGDPHLPLWVWNVKVEDILNDCARIEYTGSDTFIFYTKKILDNYSHEQV